MFRKLVVTVVTGAGLAAGLATAPAVEAHPYEHHEWEEHHRHHHEFRVYFRENCNCPWRFAGEFDSWHAADRRADHLRDRGFEVSIDD